MLARSEKARAQKLGGGRHNTFMTDVLFFTAGMPAEQRTALVGDVDATTAFADIGTWIGDFVGEHVAQR
jgi:hypothetical protein